MFLNFFNAAKAHIKGGSKYPRIDGIITFKKVKEGILLTAKINGLPQSKGTCKGRFFGLHIHERNILYREFR